jgi:hypothetical protein
MLSALLQDGYLFFKKKVVGPAAPMSRSINFIFLFVSKKKQKLPSRYFSIKVSGRAWTVHPEK